MRENIPTDVLWRLMNATPEQYAAVERVLGCKAESRNQKAEFSTPHPALSPIEAERGRDSRFVFQRSGRVWRVVYEGTEFHLDDTLGARYLDYLLHHPNETVSAFDLEAAITPEKERARDRQTIQLGLDGETAREYLRELERLRAERDKAEDAGDCGQSERMESDIAAIEAELKSGGRSVDTGERARVNVNKALAAVRKRLLRGGKAERAFAEHITTAVSLGFKCLYLQPQGAIWE